MKAMKGIVKMITVLFLTIALGTGVAPARVYAAEPIPKESFDYIYYANANSDVKAAFGTNQDALYKHYVEYGIKEGRAAKRINRTRVSVFGRNGEGFDAVQYLAANPDLKAGVGSDPAALWNHYVNHGVYEGRRVFATTRDRAAELAVFDMVESVTTPAMSDREKIQAVHDWIINNTKYGSNSNYPFEGFFINGVMLNHVAVCQGYAYTFDYAMSVLGIDCELVTGIGRTGRHAWNRVNIGGQWLYIDVTWDDPVSRDGRNNLRHNYFLITQEQMNRDHTELECTPLY